MVNVLEEKNSLFTLTTNEVDAIVSTPNLQEGVIFQRDLWRGFILSVEKKGEYYRVYVYQGTSKVASFFLKENEEYFDLCRRLVKKEYRMGSQVHVPLALVCVECLFCIVDTLNSTNIHKKNIELTVSQMDVLIFFLNLDFSFKSENDRKQTFDILENPSTYNKRRIEVADTQGNPHFLEGVIFPLDAWEWNTKNHYDNLATKITLVRNMWWSDVCEILSTETKLYISRLMSNQRISSIQKDS